MLGWICVVLGWMCVEMKADTKDKHKTIATATDDEISQGR